MLRGIDISSGQGDINLNPLPIDFVIVKATEGIGYVNPYCDTKVTQAKNLGLLWGFYHFAAGASAQQEAAYFINNCSNYFGEGIPVLDWEGDQSVAWVNEFVSTVYEQTGVWPWIYANPWRFNQGGVNQNCGRWIASYPDVIHPTLDYDPGEPPSTDGLVCCWQYASDGRVPGYDGDLDVNHFFGSAGAWAAYAHVPSSGLPSETADQSVLENDKFRVTIEEK